jgi:integrase
LAERHHLLCEERQANQRAEQYSVSLAALEGTLRTRGVSPLGPLALEVVRNKMIEAGVSRKRINQHIGRIRRMFKWAVAKELTPVAVYQSLTTLEGLRKGRSAAKESEKVKPVLESHVEAVLPHLTPPVRDMVRLQSKIGCRPEEVTILRPGDVDRTADPWIYTPGSHKTEHHDMERKIAIGSEGQKILRPWLDRPDEAYCFDPREAREAFDAERRRNRKTPHTPSNLARKRKTAPMRKPSSRYTTSSYDTAIARACVRAGVPHWHPNQLRHLVATEVRKKYGLEGSQVVLGHSTANVTQVYAERNFELAKQIMSEMG